jgi:hypothetical protein
LKYVLRQMSQSLPSPSRPKLRDETKGDAKVKMPASR